MQSVVENGKVIENSMLRVRVSDNVNQAISQIQYLEGAKFTLLYDGEEINRDHKWAEL